MGETFVALVLTFSVIDGDTTRVTARVWPGIVVEERVRFLDLDTPERHSSSPCERVLAEAASSWVRARLAAATVILLLADSKDSFGRVLAHVYVDGVELNAEMLSLGAKIPVRPYGVRTPWC
jgi:micrococcal nuclease